MPSCSIKCPKVRRDLRQARAEGRLPKEYDGKILTGKTAKETDEKSSAVQGRPQERDERDGRAPVSGTPSVPSGHPSEFDRSVVGPSGPSAERLQEFDQEAPASTVAPGYPQDDAAGAPPLQDDLTVKHVEGRVRGADAFRRGERVDAATGVVRAQYDRGVAAEIVSPRRSFDMATQTLFKVRDQETETMWRVQPHHRQKPEEIYASWPHRQCDKECSLISARERILEERQRLVDHYYLTKGMNYFDVCTCCFSCVVRGLSKDYFVRSILTSATLFAIGVKLCSELNHWYMPRYV